MFVPILMLIVFTPLLWWYLSLQKYKSLNNIPGPKPIPILGNALDLGNTPQDLLKNCWNLFKKYGNVYRVSIGNKVKIFIADAELIKELLNSKDHITKSDVYRILVPWLGTGLLISSGNKWRVRRKLITPTFHFKILDKFLKIFNSCGNNLINKLSNEKGTIDLFPFMKLLSLDIICETAMGVKINALDGKNSEYVKAVEGYLDIAVVRMFSGWKKSELLFKLSSDYKNYINYLRILHNFTNNVIAQRKKEKLQENIEKISSDVSGKRKVALLDMLLELEEENSLTNENIREEIDTFMFTGHDTTTGTISFVILALGDNPDVQEKVYEEIVAVTGNEPNTNFTMNDLQNLQYLEMVMKESQRIYTTVPFFERELEVDATLGGFCIPKGTSLTIFPSAVHRNETYYPEPEMFDPNRFLPENIAERHNFAYVPFSAGLRNCIGQRFAILEMKTIIAKIVKSFRISSVPNFKPDLGMAASLKSYNGIRVQLEKRREG